MKRYLMPLIIIFCFAFPLSAFANVAAAPSPVPWQARSEQFYNFSEHTSVNNYLYGNQGSALRELTGDTNGGKALHLKKVETGHFETLIWLDNNLKNKAADGFLTIRFNAMFANLAANEQIWFRIWDSSYVQPFLFAVSNRGGAGYSLEAVQDGAELFKIQPDMWYDIAFSISFAAQKYNISIGGERIISDCPIPAFVSGTPDLLDIIGVSPSATGSDLWIDNFGVYEGLESEGISESFIYVSLNGADTNSGTEQAPVKTLAKAKELARNMKTAQAAKITILIASGIYNEALTLNNADSGFDGLPITYKAVGNVVLSGGIPIEKSDFSLSDDNRIANGKGQIYEADLSKYISFPEPYTDDGYLVMKTSYYELFSKGDLQISARYPNFGWLKTAGVNGLTFDCPPEKANLWQNAQNIMMNGYWAYEWQNQTVSAAVSSGKATIYKNNAELENDMRYYVFNLLEELDTEGEWFIDWQSRKLFYYPVDGLDDIVLSVRRTPQIMLNNVKNVVFDGINIEYNRDYGIFGNGEKITIKNAEISKIGRTGISILNGKNILLDKLNIHDIGAAGIELGGGSRLKLTPSGNIVENCNVYNFGRIFKTYAGGINLSGVGNTARNNKVHNTGHAAILMSGQSNDNIIEKNEVYGVVKDSQDAGAIYFGRDWTGRGNIIRYNYVHDINCNVGEAYEIDTEGIYLDDMISGNTVFGNVIARVSRAALIGGGRENTFKNNIIIDCNRGLTYDARAAYNNWSHFSVLPTGDIYKNLMNVINGQGYDINLWYSKYPGLYEAVQDITLQAQHLNNPAYDAGMPKNTVVENNVFLGSRVNNNDYMFLQYQNGLYGNRTEGLYKNTSLSGMGFRDPDNQDYALNSNSPIYSLVPGFSAIPFDEIGSNGDNQVGKPRARFPRNETGAEAGDINLAWLKVSGADKYTVAVSRNSDMSSPIITKEITSDEYTSVNLTDIGRYYWQITAADISGKSGSINTSDIMYFDVYSPFVKLSELVLRDSSGKIVDSLQSGQQMTISAKISPFDTNIRLITALKNGDGRLINVILSETTDGYINNINITIPSNFDGGKLEFYIWNENSKSLNSKREIIN